MKDIKGYEGLYRASENGEIFSVRRGKNLSQATKKNGYKQLVLYKDKKPKTHLVHRLVADTFLPKVEGKDTVNHIDSNKANNNLENLEWCTPKENSKHAELDCSHLRKRVEQLDVKTGEVIKVWISGREAYRAGFKGVFDCLNPNKYAKQSAGFHWRYADD